MPLQAGGVPVAPYAAVYNNKAYVFGGLQVTTPPYVTNETWQFDPMAAAGSRWTNLGVTLNMARAYITTALVDGYVYAIGGDTFDGAVLQSQNIVERLNTANTAAGWDDAGVADLPTPSSGAGGCDESRGFGFNTNSGYTGMGGKVVMAGCGQWEAGGASALTDTFIYDVATNTWQPWEFLNEARRNHAGALIPFSAGTGTPGMWVFSGYDMSGANNTVTTEYRTLTLAPTSVRLADFSAESGNPSRPWVEPVLWTALLAGIALMGLALGLSKRRA
jgi:N-acetylneuraminic acid mutarotase